MIDVIRDNLGRYASFLDESLRVLIKPFNETRYLSGRESSQQRALLSFVFAVVTVTALEQLTRGRDLSEFQVHVVALIMHALSVLAGFLSLALAWRVVGHKVDFRRIICIDLHLASTLILIDGIASTLTTGFQKIVIFEDLQRFRAFADDCTLTPLQKFAVLDTKLEEFRSIILTETPGMVVFVSVSLWFAVAAIRLKYFLFPLGTLRVVAALVLSCVFFAALWPVSIMINFAFVNPVCP
ncbi:MAG: hypothetical protein AAF479_09400 [Pseudomonadota bacterium]